MSGGGTARRPLDLSVYLVVGPEDTLGRPVRDVVLEAVAGGVTAVQLRWKGDATRAFVEEARTLGEILRRRGVPLVVNDRVDVAMAANASGVHVGQRDMRVEDVRRLVGDAMVVGLSITNAREAQAPDAALADYAGVGPVFATDSKPDATPPLGVEGLAAACRALRIPAVGIGGIGPWNAAAVIAAGAAGVAVISSVVRMPDPRAAAAGLAAEVRRAVAGRR